MQTNPEQLKEFNRLLTAGRPQYKPWYILLNMNDKDPVRTKHGWKHPMSRLSFEHAYKHMCCGMNIGIAGTDEDMLVIVDIDDETQVKDETIKATLSVRTRSRVGTHRFYFATDKETKVNIPSDELGEIRSLWQYVVAPGSYVPCSIEEIAQIPLEQQSQAGKYTLEQHTIAQPITYAEFPFAFREQLRIQKEDAEKKQTERLKRTTPRPISTSPRSLLYSLTITDVVGTHPDNERFPSLFHGSKTGSNTAISNNQIHCFRHGVGLTPLRALAVLAGIDTCLNAGVGHQYSNAGASTIDLGDGYTVFKLWVFAKQLGIIPKDDIIPYKALVYFAITNGHCTKENLVNGWQLPADVKNEAKRAMIVAGLMQIKPKQHLCSHANAEECARCTNRRND